MYPLDREVAPHAIFWRPLAYFTMQVRNDIDDLDAFEGASFLIGNEISFDLRRYAGHPDFTVSVYLPMEIDDPQQISTIIDRVIEEFEIPKSAVGWRRGWDFDSGSVIRSPRDRLREKEARILFLKIASLQPNCRVTTAFAKNEVKRFYPLSNADKKPSSTRSREQLWQQIVGNVIVHKSLFNRGLASPIAGGLRVEEKGLNYLKSIGFASFAASCD
jgi:hypothetical protein